MFIGDAYSTNNWTSKLKLQTYNSQMERVIIALVILSSNLGTQSLPLHNGLSVNLNRMTTKGNLQPKTFASLFETAIPEFTSESERRIAPSSYATPSESVTSFRSQAKIIFPRNSTGKHFNQSDLRDNANFINLPLFQQPFKDYKILVATAPPHMKIKDGKDAKPLVIYVVFPDEGSELGSLNVPTIYFVSKMRENINEKDKVDQILTVDSNRTVTGLKSKRIAKFVKFRNKLINRCTYEITS